MGNLCKNFNLRGESVVLLITADALASPISFCFIVKIELVEAIGKC